MRNRVLPVIIASALMLGGCAGGGPSDVAVIGSQKIGAAQVEQVVNDWSNDPLFKELAKILGEQALKDQAKEAAQQAAANRAIIKLMAERTQAKLPDDAQVEAKLNEEATAVGGLEKLQEETIKNAEESGMVQGLLSLQQVRDQVRSQMSLEAVTNTFAIDDAEVDELLVKSGLPADQINDELRDQARQQVRQMKFQEELAKLDIKVNPRLNIAPGRGVLGQTVQSPNAGAKTPGVPYPQTPAGEGGQPPQGQPEGEQAQPQEGQPPAGQPQDSQAGSN